MLKVSALTAPGATVTGSVVVLQEFRGAGVAFGGFQLRAAKIKFSTAAELKEQDKLVCYNVELLLSG